ncbi:MAG: transposase [Candidatus Coatesbacteria bacterium]
MPRTERLDVPGVLYHVIVRGIERGRIFRNERDHEDFVARLGKLVEASGTTCFAWVLLPNHAHLLVRRGEKALSWVMQRLLTGYAVSHNLRHGRSGHLFQNRYKAIICEEDAYFLELVRYIHLNPYRAGMVADPAKLGRYRWSGEGVLEGLRRCGWQETEEILALFCRNRRQARDGYRRFLLEGSGEGHRPELSGGGLVRSAGGTEQYLANRRAGETMRGDVRVLGSSEFVSGIMKKAEALERRTHRLSRLMTPRQVIEKAAKVAGVSPASMRGRNQHVGRVLAKDLACKWLVEDLGLRGAAVAKLLDISKSAVSRGVVRGQRIEKERGVALE